MSEVMDIGGGVIDILHKTLEYLEKKKINKIGNV